MPASFPRLRILLALPVLALLGLPPCLGEEYETGGPLAGVRLPVSAQNTGPGPELELSPGSVEHFRAYFMKYLQVRSFFDRQSLLKQWTAPEIPSEGKPQPESYASPVNQQPKNGRATDTGKKLSPVPVVRWGVGGPVFLLDLGELPPGLYAVRIIGAVETTKLRDFRAPLFLAMSVNDGLKGETTPYRIRAGYVDEFYSVVEIYFHAPEKRGYTAKLWVDKGSAVDLLVRSVTLDDVMAGTVFRPIKQRRTLTTEEEIAQLKEAYNDETRKPVERLRPLSPDQRLARDEAIWKWLPPVNAQGLYIHGPLPPGATAGVADKTEGEIEAEFGKWELVGAREIGTIDSSLGVLDPDPAKWNAFLENKKLGLQYTVDDLWARKPLPDPFPYKDDGAGLYFPDPKDPSKGRVFAPIATGVHRRVRPAPSMMQGAKLWIRSGNRDIARDAAVDLIRYAYELPTIDDRNFLNNVTCIPGGFGRDSCCRQRSMEQMWRSHYANYLDALYGYDKLFDFIQGNEDLAKSIHRFIPWVNTSADVVALLDQYLVQTTAKRILRYHVHTHPMGIAQVAAALGDRAFTEPWMEWLFSRTFVYPLDPAGAPDLMISGHDREGPQYIGSTYYSQGEGARRMAEELDPYLRAGGNPKYDLGNSVLYPKPLAHCEWQIGITIAGRDFCRIGDVCGPDKTPGATLGASLQDASRQGWRWSADPRFAWVLKNVSKRKDETDTEWKKIEEAAATVKRAPWLDLRSRVLDNWFGVLESGRSHDDYRFRRAVYVRTGVGAGHAHADTMDLQVVAHGVPMTVDGGQRSGYSKPNDRFSRIHNTVEVDGAGNGEYGLSSLATVRSLSDAEGAGYLRAGAVPPTGSKLYERQVALIDVDEGKGSQPLAPEQQHPGSALPAGVTPANSYVFDVFRVSGGKSHSYGFHAMVNDDFQWNALNAKPVGNATEAYGFDTDSKYLSIFSMAGESKQAGDCPATFEATWRYTRDGKTGSEQLMLGKNFSAEAPRKFIRLALLGTGGMRALKADVVETAQSPVKYRFTNAMLQRKDADGKLESAFAAIIEPYAGQPFLASQRLLEVADNEGDALRAVAVEVKTRDGRTDICFADGRPDKTRHLTLDTQHSAQVSGEFGYLSTDAQGLRQATLTGGTLLEKAGFKLTVAAREHTAKVVKVDYPKKTLWLDAAWPSASAGRPFQIGNPGHSTCFTSATIEKEGTGARLTVTRGADIYRAPARVHPDEKRVDGGLDLPPGREGTTGWVLSNDAATKSWRVTATRGNDFTVDGPVAESDFAPSNAMRLWEYGVGDRAQLPTFASVRRAADGRYEVRGDSDMEVTLGGKTHKIAAADLAKGPFFLPAR